ncbi:MAG: hypothetical protein KGQ59_01080 [Bdellovibrionales bacterium]|nr:hypothetical protein [Bdellovibrionales bacterium]
MEKIPLAAIQEGFDAFRHILILERQRVRQQATRIAFRQTARGGLFVFGMVMLAFSIHLALFWASVGLYQRGWSVSALVVGCLALGGGVAFFCGLGSRFLSRRAQFLSVKEVSSEGTRENRVGASARKRAA